MTKQRFFYSTAYLLLLSAITLFFWTNKLENYGLPLFVGAMFLVLILFKDVTPAIPILMNALFMISKTSWSLDAIPLYLYLTPVALLLGIGIHLIRFRNKLFRGKMTLGIVWMFVAMILSSFNAAFVDLNYVFYAVVGLLYAFMYFFFLNSMSGDHTEYLLKLMLILGALISVEVMMYYLQVDDIIYALENKTINLGWGISNYIATYLIMFIPVTFYFAKKTKFNLEFIVLALFQIIMLLFTLSRGGIVAFTFVLLFLLVYLYSGKNWKYTLLSSVLTLGSLFLIVYFNKDLFLAMFDRFQRLLFDDTGRFEIYLDAWNKFKANPLFGAGIFARLDEAGNYRMFHNTVLHIMATFGAFGLVSLLIQVFMMFKIALTRISNQTVILAIAIMGAHAHGMVDNVYLMPQFMILLFLIIAVLENANEAKILNNLSMGER
ncbi:MAG: O-antigen ligase family protein [Bacilli bacterium]|nr:O-antigen ligase family protein [Bacilli bacterium]MBN2696346.1 O-antigen ligase family protein [Bacilli bacterium]